MGWQKMQKHKLTVQSPSSLQVPEAKERWLHCQQARTPYRNNLRSSKAWGRRTSAPRKFLDKRNVLDGIKKNKLASNVGMDNQHLGEIAWSNLQNKKTCSDVSKIRMMTPMMMAWSRKNECSVKDDGDNTNDEGDGDDRKQKFFQIWCCRALLPVK